MDNPHNLYVLFNSKTRQVTSFTFDISVFPQSILDSLLIKTIPFKDLGLPDENINLNRFRWEGDYDTGKMIDLINDKKTVVSEKEIDQKYADLFYKKYKFQDVIYQLILNTDMKTETGIQMKEFTEKLVKRKEADVEFFKNSSLHIWETQQQAEKRISDSFSV